MKYSRWDNPEGRSASFRLFERDHTQLNKIYWHSVSEKSFFDFRYRQAKKNKSELPFDILKIDRRYKSANNIRNNLDQWNDYRSDMADWIRLNSLLSLYSYFELYINRITKVAQESDPGLFLGASKTIDGAKILKTNNWNDAYLPNYSLEITKGTWQQRISALEKSFSVEMTDTRTKIDDLEKTRKIRNSIAHYFGRDLNDSNLLQFIHLKNVSLKEESLISYFDLFYNVAEELDSKMIIYIGDYEILRFYTSILLKKRHMDARSLKKEINNIKLWENKGSEYCESLIKYYDGL
jgi:hypothetical protein